MAADVPGAHPTAGTPGIPDWAMPTADRPGLGACLGRLEDAIAAARALGIRTDSAEAVRREILERLGFPADTYLLALVGGTGVGKSSLLNAIAGTTVSPASPRRPTTSSPVVWLSRSARPEMAGLLAWLDIDPASTVEHERESLGRVAIIDLPDLDSIDTDHRRRVEEVLPRVDAVVWVTDPEKYNDAVLHEAFLARWLPRLRRQAVVLNKADRVTNDGTERIRLDIERQLASYVDGTAERVPPVLTTSAAPPTGGLAGDGEGNVEALRAWLAEGVEAKTVVRNRLEVAIVVAASELADAAGLQPGRDPEPLVTVEAARRAIDRATHELLRLVDIRAVEQQAVAATRARARRSGAGPAAALTSLVYRLSGRERRVADPAGFLSRWRERGSMAPASEAIRAAVAAPIREAPPRLRATVAAATQSDQLERSLAAAVDRAVALRGRDVPSSGLWPVIGLLQTVATAALAFAAIWAVLWIAIRFPVDSVAVPVLGVVPAPLLLLVGALVTGYLIARLLRLHAGLVGRRWARRLRDELRAGVAREVEQSAFAGLAELEAARRTLAAAARAVRSTCGRDGSPSAAARRGRRGQTEGSGR